MGVRQHLRNPYDPEVRELLLSQLNLPELPAGAQVMAFGDEKGLLGAWLFERYSGPGGSVYLHWAAQPGRKLWLKRYMLTMVALYAFDQMGCEKVFGEVRASDIHVRKIDERLGFVEVATLKGCFPGDDLVIYEMTRENCGWLPEFLKEKSDGEAAAPSGS